MRIFVTGGTGFNGKYIVQRLNDGTNEILVLTRNINNLVSSENISFLEGNLSSINSWKDTLKKFKPQVAAHLAWEGIPDYGIQNSIKNLNYGLNLLELLAKYGCRTILVTGTIWEYGNHKGKLSEDLCTKPFNALTAAKNSLHHLGDELAKEYNTNLIWTRLSNSYGPGRHGASLIPYLIESIKNNQRIEIRDPNAQNDFIYVEDVAEAIYQLLLNYKKSDTFNIGSGKLISVKDIIKKIFKALNVKTEYKLAHQKQIDSFSYAYADISKIKEATGWIPQISIDEGIKKTLEYFFKK